ncbi:sensor histidine kinase [Hyphomicrobium sp.]|uniref:sensor histidine kinase n=1 Tax=Hyphomicrobium sp. TaxID=82 RepID=UPI002E33DFF9|nr:ATP-binding protein [Hyphomicrobium sp.]HEX2840023.1 ATP-binding protein [Hyphomicrobium sp.]
MLARRGVVACILAVLGTTLIAILVIGNDDLRLLYAIAPYALLFYAALAFLASEASLSFRPEHTGEFHTLGAKGGLPALTGIDDLVGMLDDTLKIARDVPVVATLEPLDLTALLRTLANNMSRARLTLPPTAVPLQTLASPPALSRALDIVLENALSGSARVSISYDHGTTALVVHVDTDGPGIARDDRTRVFEWHYYMSTPPSRQVGCRAELVIARQIARAHGGDITVAASPMGGARFTVRLPLLQAQDMRLAEAS